MTPLSLGNIILLKEKGGIRESIPRQVDKKFGVPEEEIGAWGSEEEIWVWNYQGEGKDKHLFFSTFLSLSNIKHFFL